MRLRAALQVRCALKDKLIVKFVPVRAVLCYNAIEDTIRLRGFAI